MKVLTVAEAKDQLPALLEEALSGRITRIQLENGDAVELTPVKKMPPREEFTDEELRAGYEDAEWVRFENNCAKANRL